jgi:hypothetical protein
MSDNQEPTGIPAVDNFVSAFDSEEKIRAIAQIVQDLAEQFNSGAPFTGESF